MTILSTPASRLALITRRAPSRAGTMSSSGSLGCSGGKGEATCSTPPQPATASAQPASAARSAATTVRRSPASTPACATVARTARSPATSRTVVRTPWPRRKSSATHHPPRKPVPPVTRTRPPRSLMWGHHRRWRAAPLTGSLASSPAMSIVIVGAGPNLGAAVARRFGSAGFSVGLIARDEDKLRTLADELRGDGLTADHATADIRDADGLAQAISGLAERLGPVEVLEYSPLPSREFMKPILETTVDDVRGPLEFSVLGAVAAATAVLPAMIDAGRGTILFTTGGAAVNPYPLRAGVGISFAGEVAYARMLHDEVRDRGIHVVHTAIGGRIAPGGDHEPADVAEVLWRQHTERTSFQIRLGID